MSNKNPAPETFYDFISSFEAGVNSGVEPLLLPKNQLAFGLNTSVRGAYVTHRPPIQKRDLIFASPLDQTTVETGLFQGAGYYRPDYGTEQLIAHIAGHLFSFTETGGKFVVADISVPNDFNNAAIAQIWMWQSEKWLIVQDGTGKLPIFYDGTISRRSYGPSVLLATTIASGNFPTPRVIGETLTLNLASNYAGPFNVPVIFHGAYYQVAHVSAGYSVVLTNVGATVGATVANNSQIIINLGYIGHTNHIRYVQNGQAYCNNGIGIELSFVAPPSINMGDQVNIPGLNNPYFSVKLTLGGFLGPSYLFSSGSGGFGDIGIGVPAGTLIQKVTSIPNVLVGNTTSSFIVPVVGSSVIVSIDQPYFGVSGQVVWIGTDEYTIAPSPPPALGTVLYLINLTDTDNPGGVIPIGSPLGDILSVPELPAGRMGAYGMSRNAMSLTDGISFLYGDIGRGAAGTPAYNYRDSVLKTTENTFSVGGGNFGLPGTGDIITAMIFGANLDLSLGQGPLQVGTAYSMFTCDVGLDRTLWPTQNNPILTEALIGKGPLAQNSTISVNSDTFFRSTEGIASLILARRDFGQFGSPSWGNVPISQEMKRVIEKDNQSLLSYGSAITYDNRFLSTAAPNVSGQGVYHAGLLVMNFDAISNLRTKLPPVYDGVWTGVNSLQILSGFVNGFKRAFAFTVNLGTQKIELYEFLMEATTQTMDNGTVPLVWTFETPILFNKDIKQLTELVKLRDGEIYLKDIVGTVNIEVQYRPDFYPCWTTWRNFNVCADPDTTVTDSQPGYRTRIGLGEPDSGPCEAANNRPMRTGYFFQCRVVITGSCKWMGMRASAVVEPQPVFALPICEGVCQ